MSRLKSVETMINPTFQIAAFDFERVALVTVASGTDFSRLTCCQ